MGMQQCWLGRTREWCAVQCKEESGMVRTKCSQHSSWQVGAAGACSWLQLLIGTGRKVQAEPAGGWGAGGFSRRRLGGSQRFPPRRVWRVCLIR